jgi:concanavalin A-like lectin/glucanase superfamily protein
VALIHRYDFHEGSGTTVGDIVGTANGTFSGTGQTWITGHTAGAKGLSCTTAGTVNCGATDDLEGIGKYSICYWGKRTVSSAGCFVEKYVSDTSRIGLELWTDGIVYADVSNGSNMYGALTHNDTNWHHWTMVFDGALTGTARLKLWRDAVAQTLSYTGTPGTVTASGTMNLLINGAGGIIGNSSYDDIQIYNHALTQAEINAIFSPPTAGGMVFPRKSLTQQHLLVR